MKKYDVVLYFTYEIEAQDKQEAEILARDLFNGELVSIDEMACSVEEIPDEEENEALQ